MNRAVVFLIAILCWSGSCANAQTSPYHRKGPPQPAVTQAEVNTDSLEDRVERFLRNLYAWGTSFKVSVGPIKPTPIPELLEAPVTVTMGERSETSKVYVSKDGKFLFRGELADTSADPLAEIRRQLHPGKSPFTGPLNAKVTLIEFGDFQCPTCRELDRLLREILPKYPQVRLVYKHFPLTEIHPWAMTASIASQCVYQQDPKSFWKMHDAIFDGQDLIAPPNVWQKMLDFAGQLNLNIETFKSCMADPKITRETQDDIAEGNSLNVNSTPTLFVNGRRIVGANKGLLEQYIEYELDSTH